MRLLRSIHLVHYHRPILVFRVNTIKRIPSREGQQCITRAESVEQWLIRE